MVRDFEPSMHSLEPGLKTGDSGTFPGAVSCELPSLNDEEWEIARSTSGCIPEVPK
jgi:hypothetical protein